MECNKDEAIRAKQIAEEKMVKNDFEGARKIAMKAKKLFPELDNISQLITVCDVHCAAEKKIFGAGKDLYGILQVDNVADETIIRKQYRKLALLLHPDKNKFPGAEGAFKLIGEANMTLSDQGKRSVYDIKCREPTRASTKIQNSQRSQTSFTGQQNKFKSVPSSHGQQSASNPNKRVTFWTGCPFCEVKYEYHIEFLERALKCRHCSKLFIANDIGPHGVASFVNPKVQSVNLGPKPVSQPKKVGEAEKVKGNMQKGGQFSSSFAHKKTENSKMKPKVVTKPKVNSVKKPMETTANGTNKKRGGKMAAESTETSSDKKQTTGGGVSVNLGANGMNKKRGRQKAAEARSTGFDEKEAGGGGAGDCLDQRRSSRQNQQVSYQEDGGGGFSPKKRSKPNKSFPDIEDSKKEDVSGCEEKADVAPDDVSTPKGKPKGKVQEALKPGNHHINCPDQEFTNFDKHKEEHCFAVGQIWACYDSVDAMPRFYAQIRKIYSSKFRMRITWFESEPENELESKWVEEELPVACGNYVLGENEETSDRFMFSHQIVLKKVTSKSSYIISPQKGEIWALFKDWDIKWSLNPENHDKYKFDIVEIIEVDSDCITVGFLLKVKGFVGVFQRSIWAGVAEHKIPINERFRFSHLIPSAKLTGTERAGVPAGSFELDMASLPADFEDYCSYFSNNVDMASESRKEKVKPANNLVSTPKKHVDCVGKDEFKVRRSPRGLKSPKEEI